MRLTTSVGIPALSDPDGVMFFQMVALSRQGPHEVSEVAESYETSALAPEEIVSTHPIPCGSNFLPNFAQVLRKRGPRMVGR